MDPALVQSVVKVPHVADDRIICPVVLTAGTVYQ